MTDDFDDWAEYYDILYNSKYESSEDYSLYEELLSECKGTALEIGCGSGRLYLEAIADGYDVHGLDVSAGMLSVLRDRADSRGLTPTLFEADVTAFSINNEYSLIYYPFSALSHLQGLENQRAAFERIHRHLEDGGKFAFDIPVPSFERVSEYGQLEREEVEHNGKTYVAEYWEELVDEVHQEHVMHQRVIDTETDEIVFETTFELTLIPKEQLELLLINAGFEEYTFYDGFDRAPLTSETERLVVVAER